MPDATQQQMPEPNPKTNPVVPKKIAWIRSGQVSITHLSAHMYGRLTLHLE